MRPVTTGKNIPNSVVVYTVFLSYLGHVYTLFTLIFYVLNIFFGKFRTPMTRAIRDFRAPLFQSILHVIKLRSFKKVVRIDTLRIVTLMKNTQFFIKRTVVNFIGKTMSAIGFSTNRKRTVSVCFPYSTLINPARFSFFNFRKESIYMFLSNHVIDCITLPNMGEALCQH